MGTLLGTVDTVVAHADSLNASVAKVNKALFGRTARGADDDDGADEDDEESGSKGLVGLNVEQNVRIRPRHNTRHAAYHTRLPWQSLIIIAYRRDVLNRCMLLSRCYACLLTYSRTQSNPFFRLPISLSPSMLIMPPFVGFADRDSGCHVASCGKHKSGCHHLLHGWLQR